MVKESPTKYIGKLVEIIYDDMGRGITKRGILEDANSIFVTINTNHEPLRQIYPEHRCEGPLIYPYVKVVKIRPLELNFDAGY